MLKETGYVRHDDRYNMYVDISVVKEIMGVWSSWWLMVDIIV